MLRLRHFGPPCRRCCRDFHALVLSTMQKVSAVLQLSASDLVGHLNCRYLTELDLAVANGALTKPAVWDPLLEIMAERGALHEQGYINHLKSTGHTVVAVEGRELIQSPSPEPSKR